MTMCPHCTGTCLALSHLSAKTLSQEAFTGSSIVEKGNCQGKLVPVILCRNTCSTNSRNKKTYSVKHIVINRSFVKHIKSGQL